MPTDLSIGMPTAHLASIRQMSTLKERMLELRAEKPSVTNAQLAKEAGVKPPSEAVFFRLSATAHRRTYHFL